MSFLKLIEHILRFFYIQCMEKVNHPKHYNKGKIEVIEAIEDWGLNFSEGNVVKYVARHRFKGEPLEDLKKARWYLERLISNLESKSQEYTSDD